MIEVACREAIFHFNKKSLEDPTVPAWTVKAKGKTYYCRHVTATVPWSTKETPGNGHTKGSIKLKDTLLTIDENNEAVFRPLTKEDEKRIKENNKDKSEYTRVIFYGINAPVKSYLIDQKIPHTKIKTFNGSCGSKHHICDIKTASGLVQLTLAMSGQFWILEENSVKYGLYDEPDAVAKQIDADYYGDDDE